TVTDSATGSPHTAALGGIGLPQVDRGEADRKSVVEGKNLGTTSARQANTLSNAGSAALGLTSITIAGTNATDFSETNTCGNSVAAGGSCTISVTFTPTLAGTRSTSITVTDSATGSPHTAALGGIGLPQVDRGE